MSVSPARQHSADPDLAGAGRADAADDRWPGGWDPYDVWRTRVLLPRQSVEHRAQAQPATDRRGGR